MTEIRRIYEQAFGKDKEFDDLFFCLFGENARTLQKDGKTVSILFLLPCSINGEKIYYLYAAATKENHRGKGYMGELLKSVLETADAPVFLKPATKEIIAFYEKHGFYKAKADINAATQIVPGEKQKRLSKLCESRAQFDIMFSKKEFAGKSYRFTADLE